MYKENRLIIALSPHIPPFSKDVYKNNILLSNEYCNKPLLLGKIGKGGQGERIYSAYGKSVTQIAAGGGLGAKTGLYAIPIKYIEHTSEDVGRYIDCDYEVKNGQIKIKDKYIDLNLPDGFYSIRKLSVAESCRLQTLPSNYCRAVSKNQARKALGNGWTAEIIIHILNEVLKGIPKDEEIVVLSMYDGIGTGRYCLNKMGFTNIKYYAYEIDKYAIKIAYSNFPDIIQCGNAFDLRSEDWKLPIY